MTWEGWNSKQYSSELVSWEDVGTGSFAMKLSDYVDTTTYPELEGIDFKIGWNTAETAKIEDIAKAVDGVRYSSGVTSSEYISMGTSVSGVSFSIETTYLAELASERNVETYDTSWIEPKLTGSTNVVTQPTYTDITEDTGWSIEFTMKNIGTVTATSYDVDYYTGNREEKENLWWYWYKPSSGAKRKETINHNPDVGAAGTLLGVTDCITDSANNGDSIVADTLYGGVINVSFRLNANSSYSYEGRTATSVGYMDMYISVSKNDTEDTLMKKLEAALGKTSVIDAYEGNQSTNKPSSTSYRVYSTSAKQNLIDVPIYKAQHDFVIQAGANSYQGIHIKYESLRVMNLGMEDTNTLTGKAATKAIAQIDHAEEIISKQRSLFGASQNRLEHAEAVNENTSENLQASESKIRDADLADEMMELSKNEILAQASQAMLAQAKQAQDGILQLLQ